MTVTQSDVRDPLSQAFLQGCVQAGTFETADYNGGRFEGASWLQFNIANGRRWSAATAFIDPVRSRDNLDIHTGALATRLELDGRRANGVHYERGGVACFAAARREVLLCAGPIVSPQLLELSGIGAGDRGERICAP